ncbi:patched domain-containing protein 3-like [Centruroides sculpturatus]|uniref:patched domain-containing protein 3-like n=1 Tax=Centruroides sculpturatus TaxID=218467 RepID=UPI000C6CD5CA|nr:patched domain-containing protein 3-like [Centruroides sculpturatus]
MKIVQKYFSRYFTSLGELIAGYPLVFLLAPIIMSALLATGVLRVSSNRNTDYLFTATNGKAIQHKEYVESIFPQNTSDYVDAIRITKMENIIIVTEKHMKSIIDEKVLKEISVLDYLIRNFSIDFGGYKRNYSHLCAQTFGKCFENDFINLIPNLHQIRTGKYKLNYPFYLNPLNFRTIITATFLGLVTVDNENYVKDARAARLFYPLDSNNDNKKQIIFEWKKSLNIILTSTKFKYINISYTNSEELSNNIEEFTSNLCPYIPIVFLIVSIFASLTCMTDNWIESKPWLGISACVSASLAIISGFGLTFHCGAPYADFVLLLSYCMLGMEIDDAFLLISAWRRTNPEDSVEKRMGKAYSEAAVSITITSITSVISFCIGIFSYFPIIRMFCIHAAVITSFAYIYQITFFGSCMALSGYREKLRLHCLFFRYVNENRKTEVIRKRRLEEFIGNILLYNRTKIFIVLLFFLNFSIGIWGFRFLKFGNSGTDAFRKDSQTMGFLYSIYNYFDFLYPVHIVIDKAINYHEKNVQKSIDETLRKFENLSNIADSRLRISWLKYYNFFSNQKIGNILLNGYNTSDKQDFIDGLKDVFLRFPQAKQFTQDINFNKNYTEITSSRFLLIIKNVTTAELETNLVRDVYDIVSNSELPITIYGLHFHIFEQGFLIKKITFNIAIITSALIFVIFFLFISDIVSIFCVALVVLCTILETISYMGMWNVKLDIVSLVTLVTSVGFSINYPTHISYSFTVAKNLSIQDRVKKSLNDVGLPIFQGTITTVLGVFLLLFHSYYVTISGFKILFLIAILTGSHALFVIPVFLSFFKCFYKSRKT